MLMLEMWEQTVRTAALSRDDPSHFSIRIDLSEVDFIST